MQKFHIFRQFTNVVLAWAAGGTKRPTFFDVDATYPRLSLLDQNFAAIQSELTPLLKQRDTMTHYHEIDPMPIYMDDTKRRWNVYVLHVKGHEFPDNRAQCPITCELLEQIPEVFQAYVSILEAGKTVPKHHGSNIGYLRYHLGIKVPPENPPTLHFAEKDQTWQEGESFLFDDTLDHEVTNECTDDRVVLIIDLIRPFPWYCNFLNKIFMDFYGKIYGKRIVRRVQHYQQAA